MSRYNYPFLHSAFVTICKQRNLGPNTVAFRVPYNFNKPIIQSYFEQLYGVEIVNINTLIRDPVDRKFTGVDNKPVKRRKYGFKKAFITFAKPFEMNWDTFQKQPHMFWHLHTKHLRARGHQTANRSDNSGVKKKKVDPGKQM